MKIHGIYQAQDPGDKGPREAYAIKNDTILGHTIIHASCGQTIGQSSFGDRMTPAGLQAKAEGSVSGYWHCSIEPNGDHWQLDCYEHSKLDEGLRESSLHSNANAAIAAGRKWLAANVENATGWEMVK